MHRHEVGGAGKLAGKMDGDLDALVSLHLSGIVAGCDGRLTIALAEANFAVLGVARKSIIARSPSDHDA
jgi:hypothetical protein